MCGSTGNGQALVLRNTIYQSNPLIQSKKDFDIIGMRIFLLGLRGLNPHFSEKDKFFDADFKEMFIPTDKLTELFARLGKCLRQDVSDGDKDSSFRRRL